MGSSGRRGAELLPPRLGRYQRPQPVCALSMLLKSLRLLCALSTSSPRVFLTSWARAVTGPQRAGLALGRRSPRTASPVRLRLTFPGP